MRLSVGNIEPLFCSLELIDVEKKQKISEKFYFSLNMYSVINDFFDDFNVKKLLLKYSSENPRAIFSVSEKSPHIYLILKIEKILQGPLDSILKVYRSTGKEDTVLAQQVMEACTGTKSFRQPFLWGFTPLFEMVDDCELRTGLLSFKNLYPMDNGGRHFDIAQIIHDYGTKEGTLKKWKPVPGYCLLEVGSFDPIRFENDRCERAYFRKRLSIKAQHKSLEAAIESVTNMINEVKRNIQKSQSNETPEEEKRKSKVYLKYQMNEFLYSVPKSPFFTFVCNPYFSTANS